MNYYKSLKVLINTECQNDLWLIYLYFSLTAIGPSGFSVYEVPVDEI